MSTSLEAVRRHRAVHADAPESRRVWLFHFHAYFDHDVPERIAEARAFMHLVIRTLAGSDHLEVHGFTPFPVAPHRRSSFKVLFTREAFADYVSWLMFSRPTWLHILVHSLTDSQWFDHTRRALWLGTPLAIDCTLLKEADARALRRQAKRGIDHRRHPDTRAPSRRVTGALGAVAGEYGENAASKGPGVCFEAMNRTT